MKEVFDLANGMREAIANLKQSHINAKAELASEITRANVNAKKVQSLAQELKTANKEVESFLGETGSNFPEYQEGSDTQQHDGLGQQAGLDNLPETEKELGQADVNGVSLFRGRK